MRFAFHYGVMGAGKTASLIEQVDIFESFANQATNIICAPFMLGIGTHVTSRNKTSLEIHYWLSKESIKNVIDIFNAIDGDLEIFIDEAQFLDEEVVFELKRWSDKINKDLHKNVNIQFYGLLSDYNGNIFPASKALLLVADYAWALEKTCDVCKYHRATMNSRLDSKKGYINLDKNDYLATCFGCWEENNRRQNEDQNEGNLG